MKLNLSIDYWKLFKVPSPIPEYRFSDDRRWRFDWAWTKYKVACEQEGGIWIRGRHNRPIGYQKDLEKYNEAAFQGWVVFRFVPADFRNGKAGAFIEMYFEKLFRDNH
jgi:hypothetical protein